MTIFNSFFNNMSNSGLKYQEHTKYTESLKRCRPTSDDDDEDSENIIPPNKRIASAPKEEFNGPGSSGYKTVSSPLTYSDDTSSSSVAANLYSERSNESSPQYVPDSQREVLSPLNNYVNISPSRKLLKTRKCPLPSLSWADSCDVWKRLCEREVISVSQRYSSMLENHPSLKPRMRAILLDWLNEVCDVYKLHRETFHLCVNYVDRYLTNTNNIHKNRLQLIGITSLFIAAKVEEVYPPKLSEFAYVTDGACTVEDILKEEVVILKVLKWHISPITTNGWLNIYLQLCNEQSSKNACVSNGEGHRKYAFLFTQYSSLDFIVCVQLIDFALLHVAVNDFKYSQLAAAAIAYFYDKDIAVKVSGYTWDDIEPCFLWLQPFAVILDENENKGGGGENLPVLPDINSETSNSGLSHICPNINHDQIHRIQVHNVSMDYYDQYEQYKKEKSNIEKEVTSGSSLDSINECTDNSILKKETSR